jgi:hypothetical protein
MILWWLWAATALLSIPVHCDECGGVLPTASLMSTSAPVKVLLSFGTASTVSCPGSWQLVCKPSHLAMAFAVCARLLAQVSVHSVSTAPSDFCLRILAGSSTSEVLWSGGAAGTALEVIGCQGFF